MKHLNLPQMQKINKLDEWHPTVRSIEHRKVSHTTWHKGIIFYLLMYPRGPTCSSFGQVVYFEPVHARDESRFKTTKTK